MIPTTLYHSPCGLLRLGAWHGRLCLCDWADSPHRAGVLRRVTRLIGAESHGEEDATLCQAMTQLDEYFAGQRRVFSIPLLPVGTLFQRRVWEALASIPYGDTVSYGALARSIGSPGAVRAVASAVGANALSVFLPCHRVIGAHGSLTGYAGGLEAKRLLLGLEQDDKYPLSP